MAIFGHIVSRILPSTIDLPTYLPTYPPTLYYPYNGENYIRGESGDCISRVVSLRSISGLSSFDERFYNDVLIVINVEKENYHPTKKTLLVIEGR